jgi:hypothetical protein
MEDPAKHPQRKKTALTKSIGYVLNELTCSVFLRMGQPEKCDLLGNETLQFIQSGQKPETAPQEPRRPWKNP